MVLEISEGFRVGFTPFLPEVKFLDKQQSMVKRNY